MYNTETRGRLRKGCILDSMLSFKRQIKDEGERGGGGGERTVACV